MPDIFQQLLEAAGEEEDEGEEYHGILARGSEDFLC